MQCGVPKLGRFSWLVLLAVKWHKQEKKIMIILKYIKIYTWHQVKYGTGP